MGHAQKKAVQTIQIILTVPSARPRMHRREMFIDSSKVGSGVPVVTIHSETGLVKPQILPAIVGLQAVLTDVVIAAGKERRIAEAAWLLTPYPYLAPLLEKFSDRPLREAMLCPILEELSRLRPRIGAWFVLYWGTAVQGCALGAKPFFQADFGSYNRRQQLAINERIVNRRAMQNFFRKMVGMDPWYPPEYILNDPWLEDGTLRLHIQGLLNFRVGTYADLLWRSLFTRSVFAAQLAQQGIDMGGSHQTQFGAAAMRSVVVGGGDGFDPHTIYFAAAELPARNIRRIR